MSIAGGSFKFKPDDWNDVSILVRLNSVPDDPVADGLLQVRLESIAGLLCFTWMELRLVF